MHSAMISPTCHSPTVAQAASLLCRGLAIRVRASKRGAADCQSAKQQVANLRYA